MVQTIGVKVVRMVSSGSGNLRCATSGSKKTLLDDVVATLSMRALGTHLMVYPCPCKDYVS